MFEGSFTLVTDEQPLNADVPILVTVSGIASSPESFEQPENADVPMDVTLPGIVSLPVRAEQPLKADAPMVFTYWGIVMPVRDEQFWNV